MPRTIKLPNPKDWIKDREKNAYSGIYALLLRYCGEGKIEETIQLMEIYFFNGDDLCVAYEEARRNGHREFAASLNLLRAARDRQGLDEGYGTYPGHLEVEVEL